jgi:Sugar (and other) transporter
VEEDIEEMRAEERAQQSESSISIMELICSPTLRAPLIIGIVMQLSQQLSGINAVSIFPLNKSPFSILSLYLTISFSSTRLSRMILL